MLNQEQISRIDEDNLTLIVSLTAAVRAELEL